MKFRTGVILSIIAFACVLISFGSQPRGVDLRQQRPAETGTQEGRKAPSEKETEEEKKIVDYEADKIYKARGDSAIRLVGNVIFHHNGAIIQCDSAYRYDERRMDCFGKVIINQDSTYIYGDMATYDGNINKAKVYAPIVKLVRGLATLYTYNLSYDTKTSIGDFVGGGVMTQNDNLMESQDGIYDGDKSTVKFLNEVVMRNDNYLIRTDSASFNMDTEVLTFLAKTYIWDKDRDFLMSRSGNYYRSNETYVFYENAYVMTPDQEMWADTMEYRTITKEAYMQRNIQILDTVNSSLAFGDWGYYNDSLQNGILTRRPSVLSYDKPEDPTQKPDTVYMRADSIFFYSFAPGLSKLSPDDEAFKPKSPIVADSLTKNMGADSLVNDSVTRVGGGLLRDSLSLSDSTLVADSLPLSDSLSLDSLSRDSVTLDSMSQIDPSVIVATADKIDKIALKKQQKLDRKLEKQKARDEKRAAKLKAQNARLRARSVDSLSLDSTMNRTDSSLLWQKGDTTIKIDSTANDSLVSDSLMMKPLADSSSADSMERVIRAYHNVRIFRSDFQAVADSMVGFSVDSTMNLFGRPILWSDSSQVTADQIDVYTRDEKMDWADFIGSPFLTQYVEDTIMFNQASGKEMRAFFKENSIDYAELEGNVMNYYYMEDDDSMVVAFATVLCARLTITFENQEPSKMNWSGQPEWVIYPIGDIPVDQPQRLEGFTWSPNLRPKDKYDIFRRRIRPSIRQEVMGYRKPEFVIERRLTAYKEDLLKRGEWSDRTDLPLVTADYFENRVLDF